jgi:PKD repeat protein
MTTYDDAGIYPVTFTASDGSATDDETIDVTVTNVNRAPELAAIGAQQVLEGVMLEIGVSATDPDGEALTLTAAPLPGDASFTDHGDGTGTFSWTPNNTDAGFYDVLFAVTDGDLGDDESVNIEVVDADGFILDPNPLAFVADFGGANPASQDFDVNVSDGSAVAFTATTDAGWFTVSPPGGTSPATLTVEVNIAGLAAGFYRDSITIAGGELDDVYEFVELTITNTLVVDPTSLTFNISEGDLMVASQTLDVSEQGGNAIAYEASTEADWLILTDPTGTTAGTVTVDLDLAAVTVGEHNATIMVTAEAINSPIEVAVTLNVAECPTLAPTVAVFDEVAFAGETVMFDGTVSLTSSGPGEIDFETTASAAYTFDPATGTTPQEVTVHYEQLFDVAGEYSDTAYIMATVTDTYACPSQTMVITNVSVYRPPSADTVIVVNTPAVPGMRVEVPVIFTNSCPLEGLSLVLAWESDEVHFDSLSFVGSVVEYLDDKGYNETHHDLMPDHDQVSIWANAGVQQNVPIGSEQLLGTMFLSLSCEIEEGVFPFVIGEDSSMASIAFARDCGEGTEVEIPEYIPGSIVVGTASNFVCGYVVDPFDDEIEGATVELYDDYPFGDVQMTTMSSSIGGFAFDEIMVIPFDLYAYKEGYYPGKVEDINFGDKGVKIVLHPLEEFEPNPPTFFVDYFCPDSSSTYLGTLIPVGSYVEAYTQTGLLVGQKMVERPGVFGMFPVNRADVDLQLPGAVAGDQILFTINGMDALVTGNTTFPDGGYTQVEVCLEVRGTVEKTCPLFEGWNLISWNVNTDTDDILTVLDPVMSYVDVVLGFEQGGLTFDPDLQPWSTLWDVDHLSAYWVRIEGIAELSLVISGLPVPETTPILLYPGWNSISYLPEDSRDISVALETISATTELVYGFPMASIEIWQPGGNFNGLGTLNPCEGYFIKMNEMSWLTYSDGTVAAPSAPRALPQIATSSDDMTTTHWVNLYSRDLLVDGQQVTTGTTITAHAVAGDDVVGRFTMTTNGQFGFMPVYAETGGLLNPGDAFYLKVNDIATEEEFTWTNSGDRLEITELSTAASSVEILPQDYSLAQNYPNPFNPATQILFTVPQATKVKIEVFNVLGRSISVVFEGQAAAGQNSVVWDGLDASGKPTASGVYFYRMTAENYTETRKMMLLK